MKVGRDSQKDPERVAAARKCIGDERELFVDANSAYTPAQARHFTHVFADEYGVIWLEEPLPSLDFEGLRFLRNHAHDRLEIAEGEYGYNLDYYKRLLTSDAVDVAMVDVTRCGGITGFRKISALCEAWFMPISSHCAPALHLHPGCASGNLRHAEYFHDHARIERRWFDGMPPVIDGKMSPDLSAHGHGLRFKWADAEPYKIL
jgi:L-alanine-DL-glutamate epimerase-like enolase superfamily enzyme